MIINRAGTFSFNREFYSVDFNQSGQPELHTRILNIFQRVLRFLFKHLQRHHLEPKEINRSKRKFSRCVGSHRKSNL